LFRKQASKQKKVGENSKELFWTMDDQTRNAIRAKLLEGLAREQNAPVRNKIGDAIGEIARQYVESGKDMRMAKESIQG
jgi:importin-5